VPNISVIIPAAGMSSRFGGDVKKPFVNLDGRPVFMRAIELFLNRDDVVQILLTVGPEDVANVKSKYAAHLGFTGVKIVEGGADRFVSVSKALEQVNEDADLVAIHDGVRPCVSFEQIDDVFSEAQKSGAAILASPVVATLKEATEMKVIERTVSRERLWEAQTPQVFRRGWIVEAYARLDSVSQPITDDSQLVEAAGHAVSIVESEKTNIKITSKMDLKLAGAILKILPKPKKDGPAHPFAEDKAMW
jgi:2-C-methyl-D-erythritol 4-phosphate cytidylyltransferase